MAAPDPERGAVVRAIVVLRDGEPSDELVRELQEHCKRATAPYKFPRIVEFADELPKTRERQDQARGAESAGERGPQLGGSFAGIFAVTNLGLLAIGATLPVLPNFVSEQLNGTDLEVGIVTGAFALTGIVCRPIAGNFADRRGPPGDRDRRRRPRGDRRRAAVPARRASPGLIVSRLFLGAGEGTVFTAGSAWVIDMAPEERRGRMIGLYGLAIWTGLTLGPPVGELLLHLGGYNLVWAFAAAAPLRSRAIVASRLPEGVAPAGERARGPLISREAAGPGGTFALGVIGYAAVAAFIVLSLDQRGIGHGAEVFSVFAGTVVATRLVGGGLPDRIGPAQCAFGAALTEAAGLFLIGIADTLFVVVLGAIAMGAGVLAAVPLAVAAGRQPGRPGAPRGGDGNLHRQLRPRDADRLSRGRRRGGAGRLPRRLLLRLRARRSPARRSPAPSSSASHCPPRPDSDGEERRRRLVAPHRQNRARRRQPRPAPRYAGRR